MHGIAVLIRTADCVCLGLQCWLLPSHGVHACAGALGVQHWCCRRHVRYSYSWQLKQDAASGWGTLRLVLSGVSMCEPVHLLDCCVAWLLLGKL